MEQYIEQISAYIDGEMSAAEKVAFEEVLRENPELQSLVQEHEEMKMLAAKSKKLMPNPALYTQLQTKLHEQRPKKLRWTRLGTAAACLLLFAYVSFQFSGNESGPSQQTASLNILSNFSPAFSEADISNEDVFNFAVNRQIPLCNRGQCLEILETPNGKSLFKLRESVGNSGSLAAFKRSMNLSEEKSALLDNVLKRYRTELQSSMVYEANNSIAVSPELYDLKKSLMSDILEVVDMVDRASFTGYTDAPNLSPRGLFFSRKVQGPKQYVILRLDSVNHKPIKLTLARVNKQSNGGASFAVHNSYSLKNRDTALNWMLTTSCGNKTLRICDSGFVCIDKALICSKPQQMRVEMDNMLHQIYAEMEALKAQAFQSRNAALTKGSTIVVSLRSSPNSNRSIQLSKRQEVVINDEGTQRVHVYESAGNQGGTLIRIESREGTLASPMFNLDKDVQLINEMVRDLPGTEDYHTRRLRLQNELLQMEMKRLKEEMDSLKKGSKLGEDQVGSQEEALPPVPQKTPSFPGATLVND